METRSIALVRGGVSLFTFLVANLIASRDGFAYLGEVAIVLGFVTIGSSLMALGIPEQIQKLVADVAVGNKGGVDKVEVPLYGMLLVGGAYYIYLMYGASGVGGSPSLRSVLMLFCILFSVLNECAARLLMQTGKYVLGQITSLMPVVVLWLAVFLNFVLKTELQIVWIFAFSWGVFSFFGYKVFRQSEIWSAQFVPVFFPGGVGLKSALVRLCISVYDSVLLIAFSGGDPKVSGVISYVFRLFGPIAILSTAATAISQSRQFSAKYSCGDDLKRKCVRGLLVNISLALIIFLVFYTIKKWGINIELPDGFSMNLYVFVLLVCVHRSLYISYQYTSQVAILESNAVVLLPLFFCFAAIAANGRFAVSYLSEAGLMAVVTIVSLVVSVGAVLLMPGKFANK